MIYIVFPSFRCSINFGHPEMRLKYLLKVILLSIKFVQPASAHTPKSIK